MRNVVSSAVVLLALASLVGCAGAKAEAKAPEAGPAHITVSMDDSTARALLADDDLVAVGITTLTGADFYVTVPATAPIAAPIEASVPAMVTWGVGPTDEPGIPSTRE